MSTMVAPPTPMFSLTRLRQFACLAALISPLSFAAPVTIKDFSFEESSLGPGAYSNFIGPEWKEAGGDNNGNSFKEYIVGFTADGTNHLGMKQNYEVWQDLNATYQPNTRYTLTVAVGNRPGSTNPGNQSTGNQSTYALADLSGSVWGIESYDASVLAPSTFADAPPLVFDTSVFPNSVGKTIRVLLKSVGPNRSHFDKIRLDATPNAPPGSATVVNAPATAVTGTTATLNGSITAIGNGAPTVTIYWGKSDAGSTAGNWEHSVTLPGTHNGAFSAPVTGLSANSTYYFTSRASNSAGSRWAAGALSFETLPMPPVVATGTASAVGGSSATLAAEVTSTGGETPAVTIFYGPTDGGTTAGNWAHSAFVGTFEGSRTAAVTGLSSDTLHYYRAYAENSGGGSWAASGNSFSTLVVTSATVVNRSRLVAMRRSVMDPSSALIDS